MSVPEPTPTARERLERLERLEVGQAIVVGGDRVVRVDGGLAAAFSPGDALIALDGSGELLHVPAAAREAARRAVDRAAAAFDGLGAVDDAAVSRFFAGFAARLADDVAFAPIARANAEDVAAAEARGRSTTRLVLTERMRADMIDGLTGWVDAPSPRGEVVGRHVHDGWTLEAVRDRLGVIGFVFEGRPNVFADACGVLRGGNTVVFRIGSDALGTARAIVEHALEPALAEAGLPSGAAALVDAADRAAGWALFADPRLALAVARGSGEAVHQLGSVARQAGTATSLHGTGGAWMLVTARADLDRLERIVVRSLDRKVCNTLNTVAIERAIAPSAVPVVLAALERAAAERGTEPRLHVVGDAADHVPARWTDELVDIARAGGPSREPRASALDASLLGTEWEWEASPELGLVLTDDLDEAVALANLHAPRFVVSVVSEDPAEHERAWDALEAPYVGDGFTRWVDGQWALGVPELGLSNWQGGRLLGRSGILTGDAIATVRLRMRQTDVDLHR
jgi:glutamate-5-semialdehyde dehydrogenase